MNKKYLILFTFFLFIHTKKVYAQQIIQPGFDAKEYIDALTIDYHFPALLATSKDIDTVNSSYACLYVSQPLGGLSNRWSLWRKDNGLLVIAIEGTIPTLGSWIENFYTPLVAANGTLYINDSTTFHYHLCDIQDGGVHAGWLLGLAFMANDIIQHILDMYQKGGREYIIIGHSQGGPIAAYLRSYIYYKMKNNTLPQDLFFKTYLSASPKIGNTFYAYDISSITKGKWLLNVINPLDWVPSLPQTIEQLTDFYHVNPLSYYKQFAAIASYKQRFIIKFLYAMLNNPANLLNKRLNYLLGASLYSKKIKGILPQFKEPVYLHSAVYERAGNIIVLQPDSSYYAKFSQKITYIDRNHLYPFFVNHHYSSYKFLAERYHIF